MFYETLLADKGVIDRYLVRLTNHLWTEAEALERVIRLPGKKFFWDQKWQEPRVLRLPDDLGQREFFRTLANVTDRNISPWPTRYSRKVYVLVERFGKHEVVDSIVGTFPRIDEMNKHRQPGMKCFYMLVQNVEPDFFLTPPPSPEQDDIWGLEK